MRKTGFLILIFAIVLASCRKEVLDIDKLSTDIEITHQGAMPLVKGSFHINNFLGEDDSDVLVIDGDTIYLRYKMDSLINYDFSNFTDIPTQTKINYYINYPDYDIPLWVFGLNEGDSLTLDSLGINEPYNFNLDSLRLDKLELNTGALEINIDNDYDMDIKLEITSSSLYDAQGKTFRKFVSVDAKDQVFRSIPLNEYEFRFATDTTGNITVNFSIIPTFVVSNTDGYIRAEDSIKMEFGVADLNDFEALFGYFGQYVVDSSINYSFDFGKINNLKGTFSATDPRIKLNYELGFGIPLMLDFDIVTHTGYDTSIINMGTQTIAGADYDPVSPVNVGSIIFDKTTVTNIDKLFTFPLADSISFTGKVQANPNGNPETDTNFVLGISNVNLGLELEIPLEFAADLSFDTLISITDLADFKDAGIESIDYIKLHHTIKNGFPFGIGITFELVDTTKTPDYTYPDTLYFANRNTGFLLEPAPVNFKGEVDTAAIPENKGVIEIKGDMAKFMVDEATHVNIHGKFQTTNASAVDVYYYYAMDFQLGLEYKISYLSEEDNNNEE